MKCILPILAVLISCSPYSNTEFRSCETYSLVPYSHSRSILPFSFPASWSLETENGDTLAVTATDTVFLDTDSRLRSIGFIQYQAANGYRKNLPYLLRSLNTSSATLMAERGLIRIDGFPLDYIIGNDELYSTMLIYYEVNDRVILILGRTDRRDDPVMNDFCFMGPVLQEFVHSQSRLKSSVSVFSAVGT